LSQGISGHHPGWAGAHDDDLSVLHSILQNIGEEIIGFMGRSFMDGKLID
jgi:hypothetical protein